MSEWWTYRLEDFLMFAPATYQRLFALYNAQVWPAQLLALPLGALVLWRLARRPARWRLACALIAAGWLWTAWAFHGQRYAGIHSAAPWFAAGFALQAGLLAWIARPASPWRVQTRAGWPRALGLALLASAWLLQPLAELLPDRPWQQAALFGLTPDATAVGTLGLLALLQRPGPVRWQAGAWLVPLLWCAISAATLWTLAMPAWAWLAAAPLLALAAVAGRPAAGLR
ncbi:DUF6064 family protein [Pseudorhodoferax sp. Leaf265]|uniref:DUF6064 family protein n=1 Tax=Pseudorhodoferax sp. Leaf265 TaxID=1736315 RepID=UPI0006F61961|nr:DUF6064 family protein [Pseudorhodoferax sp. Leaf265]KQP15832.1 hypothetical protein ASF45_04475 [Pseudorhodoferax sp. Leaf265]